MQPVRSKSIIVDLYGAYVRGLGGWIAIADLIRLMADLGTDEQAVRSTVSRMSRKGLLARHVRGGVVGYRLSDDAEAILAEGDRRIFAGRRGADLADGWVLAVFSIPERYRHRRHQLRSRLTWLGFGSLGGGVWIAPARVEPRAIDAVVDLGLETYVDIFVAGYRGFAEQRALVERAWDLGDLDRQYGAFVDAAESVLARWAAGPSDDANRGAFIDYTHLLHRWRKLPYLDPGLPAELLPADWRGWTAASLFDRVVARLEKRASRYVEDVIGNG